MPSCKEAAALLIANEDRLISLPDRVKVRLHLMACKTCPNFERQLLTMRNAMQQWRNYAAEDAENEG
ncbi:MAG: zf-HC2 domain-containing protein [Burkholderiaceae bacterium]